MKDLISYQTGENQTMPLSDRLSKFRSSFQFKLFWVFTLLTALISFLFSSLYIVSEIRESRANVTEQVRLLTHHLADSIRLPLYAENRGQLQELAEEAARSTEILAVVMTAADGKVLVDFRHPPSVPTKTISYTAEVRSIPLGVSIDTALTGGTENSGALLGSVRLERGTSDLSHRVAHVVLVSCSMAVTFWFVISL